jgi:hypothetical protein
MAIASYADLKLAIIVQLGRDEEETRAGDFIARAEEALGRIAFLPEREATTTLIATTGTVALPADYAGMRLLWIDGNPRSVLETMTQGDLLVRYPDVGVPAVYAVAGTNLVLGPAPASSTTLNLTYYRALVPLSDAAPTNWLLESAPDLYLAAAMVEAYLFAYNPENAALWSARLAGKAEELRKHGVRQRFGGAPLRPRMQVTV